MDISADRYMEKVPAAGHNLSPLYPEGPKEAQDLAPTSMSVEYYRTFMANAPLLLFATDVNGIITLYEGELMRTIQIDPAQRIGYSVFDICRDNPMVIDAFQRTLAGETLKRRIHLDEHVVEVLYTPLRNSEGRIAGLIGITTDITERVRAEEALRYQNLHDTLTELPNRTFLLQRIADVLASAEQEETDVVLFVLDLDRFKEINDTFSHQGGDQVLRQVAQRLSHVIEPAATVARLGGDEFAVLLPCNNEKDAQAFAVRLRSLFGEPFLVEEYTLQVEVSIGIALSCSHDNDALTLLRHADVAMYTAKEQRQGFALYDASSDRYSVQRLALLADLRDAIATSKLSLYYQPKADLKTGQVKSVEALMRWQHPVHGFIPPDRFVSLAEQTALIEPLTYLALEKAIAQCRAWLDQGVTMSISVNLSIWNLRDSNLPDKVLGLLTRYRVPAHLLCVEVTESTVMTDVEQTLWVLDRLFALGIRISIDDYGTGHCSLSYLKQLPADELKIDRAFVQHLATDRVDQAIVESTVTLAHRLGRVVVAEGVEDHETYELLRNIGCDIVQGYYLSRPVPAEELLCWLDARKEAVAPV